MAQRKKGHSPSKAWSARAAQRSGDGLLAVGLKHHQAGRLEHADAAYQQVLRRAPNHPEALHLSGVVAHQRGAHEAAAERIGRAVAADPGVARYHGNLGMVLRALGRYEDAVVSYRRALDLQPGFLEAHNNLGVTLRALGKLDEAAASFRAALAIRPDYPDACLNLADVLRLQGRFEEAVTAYRRAIRLCPGAAQPHAHLGHIHFHQGQWAAAEESYRNALALDPGLTDARVLLALAIQNQGRLAEAEAVLREAIRIAPEHANAHNNLGNVLRALGRSDEACESYRQALALAPGSPEAATNLGILYQAEGRLAEAEASHRAALDTAPDAAAVHNNLGAVLQEQGRIQEAVACFREATRLDPRYATAFANLGGALRRLGRLDEAREACRTAVTLDPADARVYPTLALVLHDGGDTRGAISVCAYAVELDPTNAEAHCNLGVLFAEEHRLDEAIASYERAIAVDPGCITAYANLGQALSTQGRISQAAAAYDRAMAIRPDPALALRKALLVPAIPRSVEEIDACRRSVEAALDDLLAQDLSLADPVADVGQTTFFLAYQGRNDRDLNCKLASLYLKACPELGWVAPHCRLSRRPGQRLRIGFLSRHLHDHTIGKLNRGLIAKLPRERFHVSIFQMGKQDAVSEAIARSADQAVRLSGSLEAMRERVAGEELDILFYPDIGMDVATYFLAFSRLAPVQCVTWGHPVTTGIPNVDYFLSSCLLDPVGADAHYSERLVRLSRLPCCYYRPEVEEEPASRERFGLDPEWRLYVCPQSLFKIHPEFDPILGEILRRDPQGRIVLIDSLTPAWIETLLSRFREGNPDLADRVVLLPHMETHSFFRLLRVADAVLDPPHFGGGNSTYEAFALGVPIVTWPGRFMRGRVTLGAYAQMGMMDLVARSPEEYVDLAVGLANDPGRRTAMRAKIRARSSALYEDAAVVAEIGEFLAGAARG